jgi:hypothetical protein
MSELQKFYFLGEYGYAFRQLLPFLEDCPWSMELVTWKTICIVTELLWPRRYTLIDGTTLIGNVDNSYRDCTHLRHVPSIQKLEGLGYKHFFSIDPHHLTFHDDTHRIFGILKKKITYGEQFEEKKCISVFPRNRKIQLPKNNSLSDQLAWIRETYPGRKIIGHGLPEERFDVDIDRQVSDVYDQINVFNNSLFLLTPSSGLADFALACGCDLILTGEYPAIEKTNPHGCQIRYWKDIVR